MCLCEQATLPIENKRRKYPKYYIFIVLNSSDSSKGLPQASFSQPQHRLPLSPPSLHPRATRSGSNVNPTWSRLIYAGSNYACRFPASSSLSCLSCLVPFLSLLSALSAIVEYLGKHLEMEKKAECIKVMGELFYNGNKIRICNNNIHLPYSLLLMGLGRKENGDTVELSNSHRPKHIHNLP